MDMALP